jgi:hypothetical protein
MIYITKNIWLTLDSMVTLVHSTIIPEQMTVKFDWL